MKRASFLLALAVLSVLFFTIPAMAEKNGTCGENVTWTLDDDGLLTISGTGAMNDFSYLGSPYPTWSVNKAVVKSGVTYIGEYAFANCSAMTSVSLPDTVTSMGQKAFYACRSLESIRIPNGMTELPSSLFYGAGLTSIDIPQNITKMGSSVFNGCRMLKSVTIADSVTELGSYAFQNCVSLEEIEVPGSVNVVDAHLFNGCASLQRVTLNEGITQIMYDAFEGCTSLQTVTLPSSLTQYGVGVFSQCGNLREILVADGNSAYCSVDGVLFTKTKRRLVEFPEGKMVTAYQVPDGTNEIGEYAFSDCSQLTRIDLPDSLTWIENHAFPDCTGLETINIPQSVRRIGTGCFARCTSLTEIRVDENNAYYCSVDGVLLTKDGSVLLTYPINKNASVYHVPDTVKELEETLFSMCGKLVEIYLPSGVTYIDGYVFDQCPNLRKVVIPASVTTINYYGFTSDWGQLTCPHVTIYGYKDSAIEDYAIGHKIPFICLDDPAADMGEADMVLPGSLETIGEEAFAGISASVIQLPEGVISIGARAFADCRGLTKIYIPASVQTIDDSAFDHVSLLLIYGKQGSAAEAFAIEKGYLFVQTD